VSERTAQHDTLVVDRTFNADATRVLAAWASPAGAETVPAAHNDTERRRTPRG
jgi:hypothetical protein